MKTNVKDILKTTFQFCFYMAPFSQPISKAWLRKG
jgi:hypothetical protein